MRSADWMLRSMQKSWRARGGHRMREAGIGCEGGRAAVRRRQVKTWPWAAVSRFPSMKRESAEPSTPATDGTDAAARQFSVLLGISLQWEGRRVAAEIGRGRSKRPKKRILPPPPALDVRLLTALQVLQAWVAGEACVATVRGGVRVHTTLEGGPVLSRCTLYMFWSLRGITPHKKKEFTLP